MEISKGKKKFFFGKGETQNDLFGKIYNTSGGEKWNCLAKTQNKVTYQRSLTIAYGQAIFSETNFSLKGERAKLVENTGYNLLFSLIRGFI